MYQPKLQPDIRCPLEYVLRVFGGKRKSRVICVLANHGTMRYSELREALLNVTDAVLAATLRELKADGMIERIQYNEIPPHTEYSLTERGEIRSAHSHLDLPVGRHHGHGTAGTLQNVRFC